MSSVRDLHNRAMELADGGFRERAGGDTTRSLEFFAQALDAELEAIKELDEPNGLLWSILHRSAGTLALDCRRFRQAEQIVATALAGEPHPEIAEELRDLLEQIYFQRHLELRDVALTNSELQFSLSGTEVGPGIAYWGAVYGRVQNSAQLIYRTAERKQKLPFREHGQPPAAIRGNHQMLVSAPRNGSFAVSLKFGSATQPSLPGMSNTADIVDEFMDLVELVNRVQVDAIKEIIPEPDYLRNFFGLAKKLAPDGKRVRQVGFTSSHNGKERSVEFTTPAAELSMPNIAAPPPDTAEPVEITGILRFADATRGNNNNVIQIIEDASKSPTRVNVPSGMMNDIVRPMWDLQVVVQGIRIGNTITLEDIQPAEERE